MNDKERSSEDPPRRTATGGSKPSHRLAGLPTIHVDGKKWASTVLPLNLGTGLCPSGGKWWRVEHIIPTTLATNHTPYRQRGINPRLLPSVHQSNNATVHQSINQSTHQSIKARKIPKKRDARANVLRSSTLKHTTVETRAHEAVLCRRTPSGTHLLESMELLFSSANLSPPRTRGSPRPSLAAHSAHERRPVWARSSDRRFHQRPRRWDVYLWTNDPGRHGQGSKTGTDCRDKHRLTATYSTRKCIPSDKDLWGNSQLACCFLPSTWASLLFNVSVD